MYVLCKQLPEECSKFNFAFWNFLELKKKKQKKTIDPQFFKFTDAEPVAMERQLYKVAVCKNPFSRFILVCI